MSDAADVIVIGAGLAGISCARLLAQAGTSAVLLDKGRGLGGRMATRRVTLDAGEVTFDHGAQYLPATDGDFAQVLRAAGARGWHSGTARVGAPRMSSLPRALAAGLDITQQVEITGLVQDAGLWHLTSPTAALRARRVVLTIPAPQARALLGDAQPWAAGLSQVRMAPCLTLMAAFPPDSPRPFRHRRDPDHPLAWIAQDSSKPGRRAAAVTWVAQAGPDFSTLHLEQTPEDIAARMLPMLCDAIGVEPETAVYARAHRWRHAQTAQPLGVPFLHNADRSLFLGGDWCLGARAEHAWQSGSAIARDILGLAHAG